ncbi:glycosyltransferase [Halopenitus sp. H-Gu1]|uniref:glycosyltransferase n=1 Tax=Halopenitus sp. H-Gu1 TaxID=3242697 RepID=UPI00359E68C2
MKLLHVSKYYYPKVGGIEWVVQQLAEGAVEAGHTSQVLATVGRGRGGNNQINGVNVRKVSSLGTALSVPIAPSFPLHLYSAEQRTDVVHFHLPDPLTVSSQIIGGRSDPKTIATYHNDIARQERFLSAYRPILDRFLSNLDRILVTSPRLRDNSPILKPYKEKCSVVPLSIDIGKIESHDVNQFDLPVKHTRPTILFVGRLVYYKGLKYLIDAMSDVDADLLIAGTGPLRSDLEDRTKQKGVDSKVKFLGYVDEKVLHSYYHDADLFVLPSVARSEGFGIVQLEAMAHGTPIVNTDLPTGVPWVSRDGETGVTVPPRDSVALAASINELLGDPRLRKEYAENARIRVREKFSRNRMVEQTLQEYEEITKSP